MIQCLLQRAALAWLAAAGFAWSGMTVDGAGTDASGPPRYSVKGPWTAEKGLPDGDVHALAQTPDGYIWVGTLYGLARFDGLKFTIFDHSNVPEMTDDAIDDFAVDRKDGALWIATGNGLLRYCDHRFERFGAEHGIGGIGQLWPASGGGVWLPPRTGLLALVRGDRMRTWRIAADTLGSDVQQVIEDENATVLVLCGGRLWELDVRTGSLAPKRLPTDALGGASSLFRDAKGRWWLCSAEGIWRREDGQWSRVIRSDRHRRPNPAEMFQTRDGQLWVKQTEETRTSLQRLVNGRLEPFCPPGFPADADVSRLLEDRERNLWIGTAGGLFELRRSVVRVFTVSDGLPWHNVQSLTVGRDDTVWVGTDRGLGGIRDGRAFAVPGTDPDETTPPTWTIVILAGSDGHLWFGNRGDYLNGLRGGQWTRLPGPSALGNAFGQPSALYEDRLHRLWVATNRGVACFDHGKWSVYPRTNQSDVRTSVRAIYQDRRGDMWFGTYGAGLEGLHDGKITGFRTALGDYNNRAWCIHEDAEGVFWIGSQNGLNRFVPPGMHESRAPKSEGREKPEGQSPRSEAPGQKRFFTFTTEQGLGDDVINNIQEDDFGYLWLSGIKGIYRVSRKELNEVATGKRAQVDPVAFGEADGMLSSECNGGDYQPAGGKDSRGRIWFPTTRGVVMIDPASIERNDVPPPVVIEQVVVDGQIVYGDGGKDRTPAGGERSSKLEDSSSKAARPIPNLRFQISDLKSQVSSRKCATLKVGRSTRPQSAIANRQSQI